MTNRIAFSDSPHFPLIADTLIRHYKHHALLSTPFSNKFYPAFANALLQHLSQSSLPELQNAELVYLDIDATCQDSTLEKDLIGLRDTLDKSTHYLLLVFTNLPAFLHVMRSANDASFSHRQLNALMHHTRCRFLVFTPHATSDDHSSLQDSFATICLSEPNQLDIFALLKQYRDELESHHQIIITDDILMKAHALAKRFIHPDNALEQAILLLDSSAAHTRTHETLTTKPVLTLATVQNVLSGWTRIPSSHLSSSAFHPNEFIASMQTKIDGQEAAIIAIADLLQQSQAQLFTRKQPFACFHFVGPAHCGKKSTAVALAETLFQHPSLCYIASLSSQTNGSLAQLKVRCAIDHHYIALKEVLEQTPYAIIVFQGLEQASASLLDELQEIILTGQLQNAHDKPINFSQSMVILLSTIQAPAHEALSPLPTTDDEPGDLMQLVMNELQQPDDMPTTPMISSESIYTESRLPALLQQTLPIIPFIPISTATQANITARQLAQFAFKVLEGEGVEISYAPEVIRYLSCGHSFKQLQYAVEQALFTRSQQANRSNQLHLQLNETGQILCCHWLGTPARQHAS